MAEAQKENMQRMTMFDSLVLKLIETASDPAGDIRMSHLDVMNELTLMLGFYIRERLCADHRAAHAHRLAALLIDAVVLDANDKTTMVVH